MAAAFREGQRDQKAVQPATTAAATASGQAEEELTLLSFLRTQGPIATGPNSEQESGLGRCEMLLPNKMGVAEPIKPIKRFDPIGAGLKTNAGRFALRRGRYGYRRPSHGVAVTLVLKAQA